MLNTESMKQLWNDRKFSQGILHPGLQYIFETCYQLTNNSRPLLIRQHGISTDPLVIVGLRLKLHVYVFRTVFVLFNHME